MAETTTRCTAIERCPEQATYIVKYEIVDGDWPMCLEHTAAARANDPLLYIESVRSIARANS